MAARKENADMKSRNNFKISSDLGASDGMAYNQDRKGSNGPEQNSLVNDYYGGQRQSEEKYQRESFNSITGRHHRVRDKGAADYHRKAPPAASTTQHRPGVESRSKMQRKALGLKPVDYRPQIRSASWRKQDIQSPEHTSEVQRPIDMSQEMKVTTTRNMADPTSAHTSTAQLLTYEELLKTELSRDRLIPKRYRAGSDAVALQVAETIRLRDLPPPPGFFERPTNAIKDGNIVEGKWNGSKF